MTLVVNLPPEIESKVREAAEAEGMDAVTYVRETITARLPFPVPTASMTEKELVAVSCSCPPPRGRNNDAC